VCARDVRGKFRRSMVKECICKRPWFEQDLLTVEEVLLSISQIKDILTKDGRVREMFLNRVKGCQ